MSDCRLYLEDNLPIVGASKQEWFAPRMQRWHKENLIPYVQGERIYADDFYLLHVAEDKM